MLSGLDAQSIFPGREYWTRFGVARRLAALGCVFLVAATVGRLLVVNFEQYQKYERWVEHTYQVLTQTRGLLSSLSDAETGQRGYLLTGKKSYLAPYLATLHSVEASLQSLRQLTADNPKQQQQLGLLVPLMHEKLETLGQTIALQDKGDRQGALSLLDSDKGKRIMDRCRTVLGNMEKEERRLLRFRSEAVSAKARRVYWTVGIGFGSLLFLITLAGMVIEADVRMREQASKTLRQSEARLHRALASADAGVWEWDCQTNQNIWSEELWILYGLEPGNCEPSYESWRQAVHEDDRAAAEQALADAIRDQTEFAVEFRTARAGSRDRWLMVRAQPVRDAEGKTKGFAGIVMDISVRRQAEEQIRMLNAELDTRVVERTAQLLAANKELESFAYSVAHDLRAPLRGIDGWSCALLEDYSDKLDRNAQRYLATIRSETQRMGVLIDDLLRLSQVSRGDMKRDACDLSRLAQAVARKLKEANTGRSIEFQIQPGLTTEGDARLLDITLLNLLENAVKFTSRSASARIEFGESACNGERAFYVHDNGVGFDMAHANMLFGAFQRLHKQSEFPGTGIGLATVQRIIRRHGGRVWAEAQPNQGATFYFTVA